MILKGEKNKKIKINCVHFKYKHGEKVTKTQQNASLFKCFFIFLFFDKELGVCETQTKSDQL